MLLSYVFGLWEIIASFAKSSTLREPLLQWSWLCSKAWSKGHIWEDKSRTGDELSAMVCLGVTPR